MERSFSQKLSYPHLNPKPNTRDRQNESVRLQMQISPASRLPQFFSVLVFRFLFNYNAVTLTLDWQTPSPRINHNPPSS